MRVIGGLLRNPGIKRNRIPIPFYMKTNLGFEPGTYIYFFIPKGKNELILTPLNPFHWRELCKINLIHKERIGAVHSVLKLVLKEGGWSCLTETVTTEIGDKHESSTIFDLEKTHKVKFSPKARVRGLRKRIRTRLKGNLHERFRMSDHEGIIRMEYLPPLFNYLESERREDEKNNYKYMGKVQRGWIQIPIIYKQDIKKCFDSKIYPKIFLFSDTEEKYVKYCFLPGSDALFWIDIHYLKFEFIRFILEFFAKKDTNINILGSYSLPIKKKKHGIFGVYSIILQLNHYLDRKYGGNYKRKSSKQILEELLQDTKRFVRERLNDNPSLVKKIRFGIFFVMKIYRPGRGIVYSAPTK